MSRQVPSTSEPRKIIYIAGHGRSGSTLLDLCLGSQRAVWSLGEAVGLWHGLLPQKVRCGCGVLWGECAFWRDVVEHAEIPTDRDALARIHRSLMKSGDLPQDIRSYLQRLYSTIFEISGARVLIDSSKFPTYARHLVSAGVGGVSIVHLVRDSRAVGYSRMRMKGRSDATLPNTRAPAPGEVRRWNRVNYEVELLVRELGGIRIRYEDFIAEPERIMRSVFAHAGVEGHLRLPRDCTGRIALEVNHSAYGNPMRVERGPVVLREDDEWRSSLPMRDFITCTLLSLPRLFRYGYRISRRIRARHGHEVRSL